MTTRPLLTSALPSLAASILLIASTMTHAAGAGWAPLFNQKDTEGWHLRRQDAHSSWAVENGILKNTVAPGGHGVDLVTDRKFWNFSVRYEFMVPDKSNSGFYLRGRHEIQIMGDAASGKPSVHGNGAIYGLKAPDTFISRPGGQWQTAEVTIVGHRITARINGKKVHDQVECSKATGGELDANVNESGPILLQGDHGTVWFRNMRIKELPKD